MATLQDSYNTGDNENASCTNTDWKAMTFVAGTTYLTTSTKLKLWRDIGTTPGTVTVSIRATDGKAPTGDDLCSGTSDGNTLPELDTSAEWRKFLFSSGTTLTGNSVYAICCRSSSADPARWRMDTLSGYSAGTIYLSGDSGANWSEYAYDAMFETYSGDVSGSSGRGVASNRTVATNRGVVSGRTVATNRVNI
jgi:hypothetical protein